MRTIVSRALAVVAALAILLTTAALAAASSGPSGTYAVKIATPAQLAGTWTLGFAKQTYTVAQNGHIVVHGRFTTSGSEITLGHETGADACGPSGTYAWKATGSTLRFTKKHDAAACSGRAGILSHTLTKRG